MTGFNKLSNAEAERLALLSEELGEVQQVIGKILRHGYESIHPNGGPTNRKLLEAELGDVLNAIELMYLFNDFGENLVDQNASSKAKYVGQWLHHQHDQK
jgi:NTP pyrophosphatase (non-canonical NTP hydrolase)